MEEVIVCAANQKNGNIILGVRHWDTFMRNQVEKMGEDYIGWSQGFITNKSRFVTRADAMRIAVTQKQVLGSSNKLLLSEDLY